MYPFETPGIAFPLSIRAVATGVCRPGEGNCVAAVFEQPMDGVDIEVIKQVFLAAAATLEVDQAALPYHGYGLGIDGHKGRRRRLQPEYALVLPGGDTKMFIVGQGLVWIAFPVLLEPCLVRRDGIVEPAEDRQHIGRDVGAYVDVEELRAVEDGVQQGEGRFYGAVGGRRPLRMTLVDRRFVRGGRGLGQAQPG